MRHALFLLIPLAVLAAGCQAEIQEDPRPRVQVLLNDGQILVGEMTTRTFTLDTGIGTFTFDTSDAGELGPLEGEDMRQSDKMVRLWLRNGSEFVGDWKHASVNVALHVGGSEVIVDVPIAKVRRLQFQGAAVWSSEPVFRILTRSGDDFFVDVTRTSIGFQNELGRFYPYLREIADLKPLDESRSSWKIRLHSGMVFNAAMTQKELNLTLAMGPTQVRLPLAAIERMEHQVLVHHQQADIASTADGLFYSNEAQRCAKKAAAASWKRKK